jgi:hypothetical protein
MDAEITRIEHVVLRLTGSETTDGLPLASFASFVEDFRRALRDFDRSRRLKKTRRGGHPTAREDLAAAFRIVSLKRGSAILELEPIAPTPGTEDQEMVTGAELLPLETLRALMDSLQRDEPIDASVADAVASARRTLGPDGKIEIEIKHPKAAQPPTRLVIDAQAVEKLEHRVRHYEPRAMRVTGRLHMIDLEPDRIQIRAADGVDWVCRYPDSLEAKVKSLVGVRVWARGIGQLQGASRGTLTIETVEPVAEFEATPLFTFERVPLSELMERQGVTGPQGVVRLTPDLSDEELDALVDLIG